MQKFKIDCFQLYQKSLNILIGLFLVLFFIACSKTDNKNNINAQFTEKNSNNITAVYNSSITLGDIDNDGDNDLILTGKDVNSTVSKIYLNNGSGNFTEVNQNVLIPVYNSSVKLEDIDNDGDLDLILTGKNNNINVGKLYLNDGNAKFEDSNISLEDFLSISIGDVNNDGYLDIVGMHKYYKNNTNAQFTKINIANPSLEQKFNYEVKLGDLDNDNDLDIVFLYFSSDGNYTMYGYVQEIYINDGSGNFVLNNSIKLTSPSLSAKWCDFNLEDFNNNGFLDILVTCDASYFRHWAGYSKIYYNDSTGTFYDGGNISILDVNDTYYSYNYTTYLPTYLTSSITCNIKNDSNVNFIFTGGRHVAQDIYYGHHVPVINILQLDNNRSVLKEVIYNGITGVLDGSILCEDIDGDDDNDIIITGRNDGISLKIYENNHK